MCRALIGLAWCLVREFGSHQSRQPGFTINLCCAAALLWLGGFPSTFAAESSPFEQRGYYVTFMRMGAMGLPEWQEALEDFAEDRANTLLLWIGGAFKSGKFPITWQYNRDHRNIEKDFVRELIDHAHRKGIKVLLALTPFGYDGVNQYPLEHPELKAIQRDGSPVSLWGMHCWGYNLCPSKPASQDFMLEYTREILAAYPDADGLMLESSDYAICHCAECRGHFFEKEYQFIRTISDELWARRPGAQIVVYPHYFTGKKVPGFEVAAAKQDFDPRWTLFFTPHSAHLDPELIARSRRSIFWSDTPSLASPPAIRAAAQLARRHQVTGFVPSLEGFSYVPQHAEGGEDHLRGTRLKPFGLPWLKDGASPYRDVLVRVNRAAVREYSNNPDLADETFRQRLAKELGLEREVVDDLLSLQQIVFQGRSWYSASPFLQPAFLAQKAAKENWPSNRLQEYAGQLRVVSRLADRYRSSTNSAERSLYQIAAGITERWAHAPERPLLER